jgi:hypothetical protein
MIEDDSPQGRRATVDRSVGHCHRAPKTTRAIVDRPCRVLEKIPVRAHVVALGLVGIESSFSSRCGKAGQS